MPDLYVTRAGGNLATYGTLYDSPDWAPGGGSGFAVEEKGGPALVSFAGCVDDDSSDCSVWDTMSSYPAVRSSQDRCGAAVQQYGLLALLDYWLPAKTLRMRACLRHAYLAHVDMHYHAIGVLWSTIGHQPPVRHWAWLGNWLPPLTTFNRVKLRVLLPGEG